MKLRFTPRAISEIADIAEFVSERNPVAARRIRAAIYETLQNLLIFPEAGRLQKVEPVRKIVTRKYAYLIYYIVDRGMAEIVILNVKHPARARDFEDV